jgi:hypothetical protein
VTRKLCGLERRLRTSADRQPTMGGVATRLTVELVPSTCWYTNVRSNVSKAVWDRLRRQGFAEADHLLKDTVGGSSAMLLPRPSRPAG